MNANALVGSYWLLSVLPIGFTAFVLFFLCIGILHLGRDHFEGLAYNLALSSEIGDAALISCLLIGINILQRPGAVSGGEWCTSIPFQVFSAVVSVFAIFIADALTMETLQGRPFHTMDKWHNRVIVPLLVYLILTLLPVILKHGTRTDIVLASVLLALWCEMLVVDITGDRLDQRLWFERHGITLPGPRRAP